MFGFGSKKAQKDAASRESFQDPIKTLTGNMHAMLVMALADGTLTGEEREVLIQYAGRFRSQKHSPQDILNFIDNTIEKILRLDRDEWGALFDGMESLSRREHFMILHSAGMMATVDGELTEKELEMLARIAHWIGVKRDAM